MLFPQRFGTELYYSDILIWAFEYLATFRSLYNRLQDNFEFFTFRTLAALTLIVSKLDDFFFFLIFLVRFLKTRNTYSFWGWSVGQRFSAKSWRTFIWFSWKFWRISKYIIGHHGQIFKWWTKIFAYNDTISKIRCNIFI